jgi:hypothetical protein
MNLAAKTKQPPVKRKLLSRHEAAALLGGVHIRTIDRRLKDGSLKGVRVGRRSMITVESAELLAAGK